MNRFIKNNQQLKKTIYSFLATIILICSTNLSQAQEQCETTTKNSLERLSKALNANQFVVIDSLINNVDNSCGLTELSQRIRILSLIIRKQKSANGIERYLNNYLDEKLLDRFQQENREDYLYFYEKNKATYNYFPLRHPVDAMLKKRAKALLYSYNYNLNAAEVDILRLFAQE